MKKIAVVFWSGTGNTEAMASAVADGAKAKGADVTVFTASQFNASKLDAFDAVAFGCPAMGAEVLEESEFAPMFEDCKAKLSGKKIALFGSYGWVCWCSRKFPAGSTSAAATGRLRRCRTPGK